MYGRRRGFTLIELLVVIAIIGILAAMLFPVFARARESARKIQCLSNVKNIALAINMYLTDYDAFPPQEHRAEVIDYFTARDAFCSPDNGTWGPARATHANPYLFWPVVLDEYIKNRDVWRCPSAKAYASASFIVPAYGDWFAYLVSNEGAWGSNDLGPCVELTFPPGWGGTVTDSLLQGSAGMTGNLVVGSEAANTFTQSLSTAGQNLYDVKASAVDDPAATPVVADGGLHADFLSMATMAYADICCAECSGVSPVEWSGDASSPCQTEAWCGDDACLAHHARYAWATTPTLQSQSARHLGGTNVGFADGHAKWFAARNLIAMADEGTIKGVGWICDPMTSADGHTGACGGTIPGMIFLHAKPIGWYGN